MKYYLMIAVFGLGLLVNSCAQNRQTAPESVQAAFKAKFPAAKKVQWDQEKAGEWEAEFKLNGKEMSSNFTADGNWVETETEIGESDMPQAVKNAIAAAFAGYASEEISRVETPGQAAAYEVELEKGEQTIEALFSADGTLRSQKAASEEEDDDND
jgi:hypothetical protein